MALDIELVCTDKELEDLVLGERNLQDLLPEDPDWLIQTGPEAGTKKTALPVRKQVLRTILDGLKKRRPPIYEEDLVDESELKSATAFGSLEILYRGKIDHDNSPNIARSKSWGSQYRDEVLSLQPSTRQGVAASSLSVRISRG